MRGLLQHWTESSIILTSKEGSVWRNKKPQKRTVSFAEDRLLTWSTSTISGHWFQRFRRELCRPFYYCSSKWRYSGIRFEVGWNFINNDENPTWWYLGRTVQIKNTKVWETQDRIEELYDLETHQKKVRTWLSQIENHGTKKYRARFTK